MAWYSILFFSWLTIFDGKDTKEALGSKLSSNKKFFWYSTTKHCGSYLWNEKNILKDFLVRKLGWICQVDYEDGNNIIQLGCDSRYFIHIRRELIENLYALLLWRMHEFMVKSKKECVQYAERKSSKKAFEQISVHFKHFWVI